MAKIIVSHGDMVEQEVEVTGPRITIGRHPHNDVVIAHRAISGQHAAITVTGAVVQVEDLGSTNGTFVNGHRIARHTLAERDIIKVALHTLFYTHATAAPATLATPVSASIEVLNGPNAGKKLDLTKPLTTLGSPGVLVVVIGRNEDRFFINQIDGAGSAIVNGTPVGSGQCYLDNGDIIDLTGTQMKFLVSSGD